MGIVGLTQVRMHMRTAQVSIDAVCGIHFPRQERLRYERAERDGVADFTALRFRMKPTMTFAQRL